MNIYLIKKIKIYFLILHLAFLALCTPAFGDISELGYPFFYNIKPSDNGYDNVNFSITQDSRDVLYVGNFSGVLEFDGKYWNNIKFTGNPILAADNYGRVYCAGYNTFGFLAPNAKGKTEFHALINDSLKTYGQFTTIIHEFNKIYLATANKVFEYKNGSISQLFADSAYVTLVQCNHRIYIASSAGVFQMTSDNKLISIIDASVLPKSKIVDILSLNDKQLFITTNGIYTFQNYKFRDFSCALSSIIDEFGYSAAIKLRDGSYALGTQKGGIFFFLANGFVTHYLDRKTGLYDDNIVDIYVDHTNNLWVAFSNGLAKIEVPSAFSYFDKSLGLRGKVNSIVRYNDMLYVATSNGLFRLQSNMDNDSFKNLYNSYFEQISSFNFECNTLIEYDKQLLVATQKGLYSYSRNKSIVIIPGNVQTLQHSQTIDAEFYVAVDNYIYTIELVNNSWIVKSKSKPFPSLVSTLALDSLHLWVGTEFDGVFSVDVKDYTLQQIFDSYKFGKGLPAEAHWIDVYNSSKGVLFSTYSGIYKYDYLLSRFIKDDEIEFKTTGEKRRVQPIVEDEAHSLWFSYETSQLNQRQIAVAWNVEGLSRYTVISQPFNRINDFVFNTIYPDNDFVVWFGGFDGLIRLDFKQLVQDSIDVSTLIRKVVIGNDSVLTNSPEFNKFFIDNAVEIEYKYNNLKFVFSTPVFEKNISVLHQYKLEGYDTQWSLLNDKTTMEYTNLPPGEYTFLVRAQNLYGYSTTQAQFKFVILKPFYATWWAISGYIFILFSFIVVFSRWRAYRFAKEKINLERIITDRTEDLLREKEKTERLLSNILPERTVKELKDNGRATSMRYNMVTVLFSDIQGFTKIAELMNPDTLVDELDKFFLQFDNVVGRCNIEKIKTIGDAYMCAGGIPQKNRTNPLEVVTAALEMQHYISEMKRKAKEQGSEYWGLRIGVHTGPVVAGVIGSKKFTYDIWGDTVNIASRMESSGEVGKVNVSEDTYMLIKQYFDCEYRGRMPVKYKGDIDMYFVNGFKVQYARNTLVFEPNQFFINKLNLLKYEDLEIYILDKLEEELPDNIFYHGVIHTIDVIVHTEIIAKEEGVSDEDLLLLKTAALFHDIGFIVGYRDHEMLGIQMANEILPKFHYTEEQIKIIGDLIYATRMPHNPKNLLEQIICDADLDYLGRTDYVPVSRKLYQELQVHEMIKQSEYEWNKLQQKFLQSHRFFTETSKLRREENKMKQLAYIKELNEQLKEE